MSATDGSRRWIAAAPALVVAEDDVRADALREGLEELGLAVRAFSLGDLHPASIVDCPFSLALLSLDAPAGPLRDLVSRLRARDPRLPILLQHGSPPPEPETFAGAILLDRGAGFPACRSAVCDVLGLRDADDGGTMIQRR